ncbi:cystathionine gamma-synthase [Bacillus sp. FJAT-27225]|uniref:trans-sulfuration enzyme family protein n=1 Tax=Bacillus sp. FJAT-27225 TaxID=1743144 RepID=UPI00080C248A|nr:aminotransferase class V-fold PLP-dependent enzyme [Bacillus sp. FJAT-27225]OCA83086.1 cystathionine gamma-synthase [Bacillus sp. FJAT-27225]
MATEFETRVLHGDKIGDREIASKVTPIYQTSAFTFKDLDELEGFYQGSGRYLYSRTGNPNTDELGAAVARLEGAPAGAAAASGLAAILAGILAAAKAGDHIIAADDLYGGSYHLLKEELRDFGIETSFVSFSNLSNVEKELRDNTRLIYTESITNPLLRVENLEAVIEFAKQNGLLTLIDNTFATPLHVRPFELGVDMVVHSSTKYIGGHSDVTSGVIVGREDLIARAGAKISNLGSNLSPFEAWLTVRGLKTLALRMKTQSANARKLAGALKENADVERVYYPFEYGGENGYGAIVTVELSEKADMNGFFRALSWIKIAPTLAGVETTVSHPEVTSHRALSPEERAALGINRQVVRISVGIEHAEDIIGQFEKAIKESINK